MASGLANHLSKFGLNQLAHRIRDSETPWQEQSLG